MRQTVHIYIHRPAAEGGETDTRFREANLDVFESHGIEFWRPRGWTTIEQSDDIGDWVTLGTIWRIPGSDAPSGHLQALAKSERSK